ncbi:uncharacterized protein LOC132063524 isoform X4 [Lycium ferocissimum]|uniref:uncharacterized protein LOC132063524 isoform X4 n=1 Tax=Lycium ferocissimum TaxID=112874 RepID=UPI0028160E9D|nr:uncharacterized protein LOC132063524 isoform X4 [Lycium ferocissimum]
MGLVKPRGFMELKDKDSHYMDRKESGKGISEEVTRESLIALSYCVPEKDPSIESPPEISNESPDTEVQPVSPGEFKG